jgi:alkylation response protein AidB-like acyl-CoA dehydrogenase
MATLPLDRFTPIAYCAPQRTLKPIADPALQIFGGAGYMWETEINRLYRAARMFEIGAGTTQIRQLIVAEELLGIQRRPQYGSRGSFEESSTVCFVAS